jgi:hypothetical protein
VGWIELSIAVLQVDMTLGEFKQNVGDVVHENDEHTNLVIPREGKIDGKKIQMK